MRKIIYEASTICIYQGSILGPLLLNIFTSDLDFLVKEIDLANYVDDDIIFGLSGCLVCLVIIHQIMSYSPQIMPHQNF